MDVVLMKRVGMFFKLKPNAKEGYIKAHNEIWPEMRDVLNKSGIKNYSIWNVEGLLFAYYEIEDEKSMQKYLASSKTYGEWRNMMEKFVYIDPTTNIKEWPMEMVFFNQGK
jgi:L-rhamnose mutarotase